MNKVNLIGRITKDLELKKTQSGVSMTDFTLAVNRVYKQDGQPDADFIRIKAWKKKAEVLCQYCGKGHQIGVSGRIETGSYIDKNGSTVYTTDVVAEDIYFLGSKQKETDEREEKIVINEDDLPF